MKRFSFFLQEEENLQEGINDPNLFKAIFMAGGPGAGKSFITNNLINLDNVKNFNVDQVRVTSLLITISTISSFVLSELKFIFRTFPILYPFKVTGFDGANPSTFE